MSITVKAQDALRSIHAGNATAVSRQMIDRLSRDGLIDMGMSDSPGWYVTTKGLAVVGEGE